MSISSHRPLRVHASPDASLSTATSAASAFERLMAVARSRHRRRTSSGDEPPPVVATEDQTDILSAHSAPLHLAPTATQWPALDAGAVFAALASQQDRFARLGELVGDGLAQFCVEPAVIAQGRWEATWPLDHLLGAGSTLFVVFTTSYIEIALEVPDTALCRTLAAHSAVLRDRIAAVLYRCGDSRNIEVYCR